MENIESKDSFVLVEDNSVDKAGFANDSYESNTDNITGDLQNRTKSSADENSDIQNSDVQDNSYDEDYFKWYALRTFTSHETRVKNSIESESKRLNLNDRIKEVVIPQETVFEVRNGKRKSKVKNFLPGYILVCVHLDKKILDFITHLPSVVSVVGRRSEAVPLQKHEVDRILGRVEERKDVETIENSFQIGDPVKVIDGPFSTFSGTIKEINNEKQKVKVEVGILGRKTPVELDFGQIEMEILID